MYNQLNIKELDNFLPKIKAFDFSKSTELLDIQFESFLDSIGRKRLNVSTCDVYDLKKQSAELTTLFQNNTDFQHKILYFIDSGINYSNLLKQMFSGFLIFVQNYGIGARYVHDAFLLNELLTNFFLIIESESEKKFPKKKTNQL